MDKAEENKIVIVEDEGLIAADLRGRLTNAGYSVTGTAASGHEALSLIRKTTPDLILMDIRLKGDMDGVQVAEQVRQQFDIPVIFLTAYEDKSTLERAAGSQAYGYIKKPIAAASLKGSIELALAKHRHEQQLRDQRDWALASFAAVPYAVLVTDRYGRLSYLNAKAEELTGWTPDKALGAPCSEVLRMVYRESGDPVDDLVQQVMETGECVSLPPDVALEPAEAPPCSVEGMIAPRWGNKRMDGTVIALRDATLPRFEEERSRLDTKHDSLRRMAETIFDRLPNWQTAVWNTTLLLDSVQKGNLRECAEDLDETVSKMSQVSCDLATLSNPPEVELRRVFLKEFVAQNTPSWNAIVPESITIRVDPEPLPVQADPAQLKQTLNAVLEHARRRLADGGQIVIEASRPDAVKLRHWGRIRIDYPTRNETMSTLERIFEPAGRTQKPDLFFSYALVKAMGGLLTAHINKDVVSFDIHLPLMNSAVAAAVALELPAIPEEQNSTLVH